MIPKSTKSKQDYRTPAWFRDLLMRRFEFDFDVAANEDNTLTPGFFSIGDDALSKAWPSRRIFFKCSKHWPIVIIPSCRLYRRSFRRTLTSSSLGNEF